MPDAGPATGLTIGRLARDAGCAVETVRHYERLGLLAPPSRSAGNQRRYDAAAARRLGFIRHARMLGLSLADIGRLLSLAGAPEAPCADADALIVREIGRIDTQIARLRTLKATFERMLDGCGHGRAADCGVLGALDARSGPGDFDRKAVPSDRITP